jgi:hypothetical protein
VIKRRELAHLHSVAVPFLGGLLGFGFAKLVLPGAHGTTAGIALAATAYALLGKLIDIVLTRSSTDEHEWIDPLLLWFSTMIISVVLLVPAAALLAPGYELDGVIANLVAIVLVYAADSLVSRASPWGGVSPEVREQLRPRGE